MKKTVYLSWATATQYETANVSLLRRPQTTPLDCEELSKRMRKMVEQCLGETKIDLCRQALVCLQRFILCIKIDITRVVNTLTYCKRNLRSYVR